MSVLQDLQKLNAGTLVIFYALDLTPCIGKFGQTTTEKFLWCDGINELGEEVTWSGAIPGITGYDTISPRQFLRFPIQSEGFDRPGDGTIPRPKLAIANTSGVIGALTREYNDLVGAKLVRIRTFLKYLDVVNFKKRNLLLYSNNTSNTVFFTNQVIKGTNNLITLANTTDPYIGQSVTNLGSIKDKTYFFGVKLSSSTATGKYVRLHIYSNTQNEVYSTVVGPLTATPTLFYCHYTFKTSTDTSVSFRVDPESWAVGNTLTVSEWQANEGSVFAEYQETQATHNPYADPTQYLDRETWTVDRKSTENSTIIEWELTAPYDLVGVKLPRRQCIQNACVWKYKSAECGYTGNSYFDKNDISVVNVSQDVCGKRLSSCKARFGANSALPFGGFPSVGLN